METKFKVGQRVECFLLGWGTIQRIDDFGDHPIIIHFDNGKKQTFTLDGKDYYENLYPSLSIHGWTREEKHPEFESGELVWVSYNFINWDARYYSHFEDDRHRCFLDHKKEGSTKAWGYIRKFEDRPF